MLTRLKRLTNPLLAGLTVLGGIVSLLTLYPRMTVTVSFDTNEPLSSSFLISNDGYLPAYSVSTACLFGVMSNAGLLRQSPEEAIDLARRPFGSELVRTGLPPVITLNPGAKESIPFDNCFSPTEKNILSFAHVGLRVFYRPMLWPTKRSIAQEFYARKMENGRFFWYSVPYLRVSDIPEPENSGPFLGP
jgi:hypothetical protein